MKNFDILFNLAKLPLEILLLWSSILFKSGYTGFSLGTYSKS